MTRILGWVLALAAAAALGAGGFAFWMVRSFRDTPFGSEAEKVVEVPAGAGPAQVVRLLARAGVLSDERLARWYVRYWRRDPRPMKVGEYAFRGPMRPDEVLERIYRGEVKTYAFTVPEGLRMDEVAQIVERAGLGDARELAALMRDASFAKELGLPFPALEGWLFPDTYSFPRGPNPRAILSAMVSEARQAYRRADADRLPGVALSEGEAVTLASIVEKETGRADERARIACVFHNRLSKGMRLQTDPTVLYAKMLRTGAWSQNITRADLQAPHPYNTYTSAGLPPGPVANPGEAALRAVLHPAECRDLYFVSRNDGSHEFCPDIACHSKAVRRWQVDYFRKRRAEADGSRGKPPPRRRGQKGRHPG